jgi:DNA-directed RNA polymerase specialized sigma subunit
MNKNIKEQESKVSMSRIEKELESIKKLIVLLLLKTGASQNEIAAALGIDQSRISRMFPGIRIKRFDKMQ